MKLIKWSVDVQRIRIITPSEYLMRDLGEWGVRGKLGWRGDISFCFKNKHLVKILILFRIQCCVDMLTMPGLNLIILFIIMLSFHCFKKYGSFSKTQKEKKMYFFDYHKIMGKTC